MRTATNEALDALTAELVPAEETISGNAAWKKYEAGWRRRLGPAQQRAYLNQRAGRKHDLEGEQPVVYCANPEGPSHWLYKRFFPNDPDSGALIDEETGEPDEDYARYHIPMAYWNEFCKTGFVYEHISDNAKGEPQP